MGCAADKEFFCKTLILSSLGICPSPWPKVRLSKLVGFKNTKTSQGFTLICSKIRIVLLPSEQSSWWETQAHKNKNSHSNKKAGHKGTSYTIGSKIMAFQWMNIPLRPAQELILELILAGCSWKPVHLQQHLSTQTTQGALDQAKGDYSASVPPYKSKSSHTVSQQQ